MAPRPEPSAVAVVLGAVVVVIVASIVGGLWGAKGFVMACLIGSICAGLVLTNGR